ncbi:hypothetical protein DPEC_G00239420 [Dallia pectoralis]|uniref:Uncharacterized protein n=1 Tax=Dallia pectoralis TaxID=75939 RepID=A0ACC2FYX9_DALPE|nr:hypothetical protein DPEC_G00239420 [Dallia pectoralis]
MGKKQVSPPHLLARSSPRYQATEAVLYAVLASLSKSSFASSVSRIGVVIKYAGTRLTPVHNKGYRASHRPAGRKRRVSIFTDRPPDLQGSRQSQSHMELYIRRHCAY